MNTFGTLFRLTCFGESHGVALGGVIDGCPAGVVIDEAFVQAQLDRRRPGQSALTTSRNEADKVQFLSVNFEGKTTGTPIGFVIYNKKDGSLFGARDIFGIKPFYYTFAGEDFLFGSEIKSFVLHPNFKKELNEEALAHYLSFQYSPTEETFFKDVFKLPPAHYITYKDGKINTVRYFRPDFNPQEGSLEYFADLTDKAVRESVAAHKISADVEVGSFLSSGIDSSYIAEAANVDKTFTVGFESPDGDRYNEIHYAQNFAKTINVENIS